MSFSSEQLEAAKQLRAGFRSSGTFRAQPTPQLRSSNGLVRPLPSNASQNRPGIQPPSGHSVVTRSVAARIASQRKPQERDASKKAAAVPRPPVGSQPSRPIAIPVSQKGKSSIANGNVIKEKAKVAATAPSQGNWKPVVTFYGEGPAPEAQARSNGSSTVGRSLPAKPIQTNFVSTKAVQTSLPRIPVGNKAAQTHADYHEDLIDFKTPEVMSNANTTPADLLSDAFDTLTPPSVEKTVLRNTWKSPVTPKPAVPDRAPNGLREALELSKAGKPFIWNYSEGPPQIREIQQVEEQEDTPNTPDDEPFIPWVRPQQMRVPWLEPYAGNPMDLDSPMVVPPRPPRNIGLKGSRHND